MNLQEINASASPEVQMNENFETVDWTAVYGKNQPLTSALVWGYYGGIWGGFTITEDTVTLTDNTDNYLSVEIATGILTTSTATTHWLATGTYARVYKITTLSGVVTVVEDHRAGPNGVFAVSTAAVIGDVLIFRGVINCAANPNYPAGDAGDVYKVSVAGKIGGGSGPNVEAGDTLYCITDGSASGTHAGVGANWVIAQTNVDGPVTGPASVTSGNPAVFSGTTGKIIAESTLTALLDSFMGSTRGQILYRNATVWTVLAVGTAGQQLKSGGAGADVSWVTEPYDIGGGCAGVPTASLVILRYPVPRAVSFVASLTGSQGVLSVAATAQTDFDILKNGVSFGTMRFAAAGTVASFISASGSTFAAGDILTVVAPASPDATAANLGFALAGTR